MRSLLLGFLLWLFVIPSWGQVIAPSRVFSGQQAVTATSTALPSTPLYNGVVISALTTNTINVYVGPCGPTALTTSNGYPLIPGQSISYGVTNANAICVIASTTGASIAYAGN